MKVFELLTEPAEYTQAYAAQILRPLAIPYAYRLGSSLAGAAGGVSDGIPVLQKLSPVARWRFLWRILRTYEAIIVNDYASRESRFLFFWNALVFKRKIFIDADDGYRFHNNPLRAALKRLYLHALFTRPSIYGITPGAILHPSLFRHYGMPEKRIFTIPMCVDNNRFERPARPPHKPFRFGYIGRLVPHKCVVTLLEAFATLPPGLATVEILGAGPSRNELERTAPPGVTFHGTKFGDEKVQFLQTLDCLVLPSVYEPWGLVVNEALAAGIPCIVSDRVGCREDLITASGGGDIVPVEEPEALAAAMTELATDPGLYARRSAAAAAFMKTQWNLKIARERFEKMLQEVAHG